MKHMGMIKAIQENIKSKNIHNNIKIIAQKEQIKYILLPLLIAVESVDYLYTQSKQHKIKEEIQCWLQTCQVTSINHNNNHTTLFLANTEVAIKVPKRNISSKDSNLLQQALDNSRIVLILTIYCMKQIVFDRRNSQHKREWDHNRWISALKMKN